jgi:hypothetical protein
MAIYELEDKDGCPNCHHQVSMWLGFSSVDNDGVHLAYRCPNCGLETCDLIPDVDDIMPAEIAWRRETDGVITWYLEERAEQGLHPTSGSLPDLQAVSTPQPLASSQALSTPPTCG